MAGKVLGVNPESGSEWAQISYHGPTDNLIVSCWDFEGLDGLPQAEQYAEALRALARWLLARADESTLRTYNPEGGFDG